MGRNIGSSCRLCRREGEKLFLKGRRCSTEKCGIAKREFSPGQHGLAGQRKKNSNYATQLRMKQKVKRIYGVLEKQFRNYFDMADRSKGVTGEVLLQLLERRLDNVVYRSGFSESRNRARQVVRHRFVRVNGRKVDIPSYHVEAGDIIEITGDDTQRKEFREVSKLFEDRAIPEWMEVAAENLTIKVVKLPARADIGMNIQESLIVELYSK
ncbi:MAG: 30S ribosomal protein S4 [Candidatus Omnitrophica bacterium]|nr:30S ribosomal protein S4 [Candidatus Omnitrophota bacterium]